MRRTFLRAIKDKAFSAYARIWNHLRQAFIRQCLLNQTRQQLLAASGSWSGKTIFIVGNGPSLERNQIRLAAKHSFIALNRAYQLFEPSAFELGASGYLIINDFYRNLEVLPTLSHQFKQVVVGCHNPDLIYFYPALLRPFWIFANCAWDLRVYRHVPVFQDQSHVQKFSSDFSHKYYAGRSVLFSAIQFAAYLGVARIVLIGCDMDFSGLLQYSPLIKNDRFELAHLGHFDYAIHGRPHMSACRKGLNKLGIEILNGTPAGAIQEIPRVSMDQLSDLLAAESP
jgi:hypothetical protein